MKIILAEGKISVNVDKEVLSIGDKFTFIKIPLEHKLMEYIGKQVKLILEVQNDKTK